MSAWSFWSQGSAFSRATELLNYGNSQTITLLEGPKNAEPRATIPRTLVIADDEALVSEGNTTGIYIETGRSGGGQISVYVVRKGDTLSAIAKMFNVSVNTIVWANDLRGSTIKEGQELVILPISGVRHVVKSGDTLKSIATKYKTNLDDILAFNDLSSNAKLSIGDEIIVPDGELTLSAPTSSGSVQSSSTSYPSYSGYYLRPVAGGRKTQGVHGHNGIDFGGLSIGSPIVASAEGTVIIARAGGWNGGYGSYVVISHPNGTQTLYAHLSTVSVSVGQRVSQGDKLGGLGNTGKVTGPHLHFEIRGAKNPF